MRQEEMQGNVRVEIEGLSCLNMRSGRREDLHVTKERIGFTCTMCSRRSYIGAGSWAMLKMNYCIGEDVVHEVLCDRCMDILTDLVQFGPLILRSANNISSRVAKMSLVRKELFCWVCRNVEGTHVDMKFDDLRIPGGNAVYCIRKVCARCLIGSIQVLRDGEVWRKYEKYETPRAVLPLQKAYGVKVLN